MPQRLFHRYKISMKPSVLMLLLACLLGLVASTCPAPSNIIPASFLDSIFDATFATVRSTNDLNPLLSDPTLQQLQYYLLTFAPAVLPLLIMAVLTFLLFVGCCAQLLCFNVCSNEKCGTVINSSSFNPSAIKCGAISYLLISVVGVALCIISMIIGSDLGTSSYYVDCVTADVVTQAYSGNNNPAAPWAGLNSFSSLISAVSVNYQNVIPTLTNYFSTSNPSYNTITSNSAGSLYANSQIFVCPASISANLACPFSTPANCPSTINALFSVNYCNASLPSNSAQANISNEMMVNSTAWRGNIMNMSGILVSAGSQSAALGTLATSVTSFVTSVSSYESLAGNGINFTNFVVSNVQIAAYVFYAFVMLSSLLAFTSMCCAFAIRNFKWNCMIKLLWGIFTFLTISLFLLSAFLLTLSFATYDSCSAYTYFFNTQANFATLPTDLVNGQMGKILSTCFFANSTSIFSAFNSSTTAFSTFQTMKSAYYGSIPSALFTSAVNTIDNTLTGYSANPNAVAFSGGVATNSAQAALNSANMFASFMVNGSTQTCNVTLDYLSYNPAYCAGNVINGNVGTKSCILLNGPVPTSRTIAFTNAGCSSNGTAYTNNFNSLTQYGVSLQNLVSQYLADTGLTNYLNSYFAYYQAVMNFMTASVQGQFMAFLNPYNKLYAGASCSFVVSSLNNLASTSCNSVFPYIHTLSVLTISLAACSFVLMVLSYFMATRLEFYEYLEGNFGNYLNPKAKEQIMVELDSRDGNTLFIGDTNRSK